jgi:hypothetical protein
LASKDRFEPGVTTESVTMVTIQNPVRRLILAGGFAVAIAAAPAIAVFALPTTSTPAPVAQCAMGEVQDPATGMCMPAPAQGSVPEIQGIPCTGANTGECIGLGEEQQPPPVPRPPAGP